MSSGLFIMESLGKRNPFVFTVLFAWSKKMHKRNTEKIKVGRCVTVAPNIIL